MTPIRWLSVARSARSLRGLELQVGSRVKVDADRMPGDARSAIDAEAGGLAALDFALCCYERVQPLTRVRCVDVWGATFWNEPWRTFAVLTAPPPSSARPLRVHFWSLLRDGSRLLTTNGEPGALVGDDPRTEACDRPVPTLASQCAVHFDRLRALPPSRHPVRATAGQLADTARDDARARLEGLAACGDLVAMEDGTWRFTARGALRHAHVPLRG
jgi:hypothetical protein